MDVARAALTLGAVLFFAGAANPRLFAVWTAGEAVQLPLMRALDWLDALRRALEVGAKAGDQIGAILAVTAVVLGLITRSRVSPAS